MSEYPMQKITIYNKSNRYVVEASVRITKTQNHNKNGFASNENGLIRIFDIENYNNKWFVEKEDIIVNKEVFDEVESAPMTTLSNLYGKDNVFRVNSVTEHIYEDYELPNHIKLGVV